SLDGSISINLDNGAFTMGGDAKHTKDESVYTHTDGTYTKISADGFKRHVGTTDKDYHYLACAGKGTSTIGLETIVITLPEEFKGKNFSVIAMVSTVNAYTNYYALNGITVYASEPSPTEIINGTFSVYIQSQRVKISTLELEVIALTFSYIAIA
ncbi:hypothetical protein, partial [Clostridium sp.]|uniref:hypothetical protein n=1 Tax=Clostridium sp. TaxID=1506 RepID=UPI001A4BCC88